MYFLLLYFLFLAGIGFTWCAARVQLNIWFLFYSFFAYKSTMPTVLFSFFGKRYVCKPATFHRRIAANIVTNIYSFFFWSVFGFHSRTIFFDNIHTHRTKLEDKQSSQGVENSVRTQLFRFHPTWPYLLIVWFLNCTRNGWFFHLLMQTPFGRMRTCSLCTPGKWEMGKCAPIWKFRNVCFFVPRAKFTRISTCQVAELLNKLARGTLEMKSKFYPLFMPHSWERVSISEIFA